MLFREIFESIEPRDVLGIYPHFKVRVIACKISPADPMFECLLEPTRVLIERLFSGQPLGRTAIHPTFVFPERWMTPIQTQKFMQTLHESGDSKSGRINTVDIITGSAVVLTDFTSDMIRVVDHA